MTTAPSEAARLPYPAAIGEGDISNVEEARARLEEELAKSGRLTLDTSELSFIDSQGLRMLIALGEQAAAQSTTILIANCSKMVLRAL